MLVESIQRRELVTVPPATTVRDAARRMREARVGCLVVVDEGRAIGIVTERDLVERVLAPGRDPARTRVLDVMTSPVATVDPAAHVEDAAERMRTLGVKRLVVVLGGEVRGIVSATDIAYATDRLTSELIEGWVKPRWED